MRRLRGSKSTLSRREAVTSKLCRQPPNPRGKRPSTGEGVAVDGAIRADMITNDVRGCHSVDICAPRRPRRFLVHEIAVDISEFASKRDGSARYRKSLANRTGRLPPVPARLRNPRWIDPVGCAIVVRRIVVL